MSATCPDGAISATFLTPLFTFFLVYCFAGISVVCSKYFLPSIDKLAQHYHISDDIVGATFMAIGSSCPEIFISFIDIFFYHNNIGTGTLLGGSIFNMLACNNQFQSFYLKPLIFISSLISHLSSLTSLSLSLSVSSTPSNPL